MHTERSHSRIWESRLGGGFSLWEMHCGSVRSMWIDSWFRENPSKIRTHNLPVFDDATTKLNRLPGCGATYDLR